MATADDSTKSPTLPTRETDPGSTTDDERLDRTSVSPGVTGHKATKEATAEAKENDRDDDSADDTSSDGDA